MATAAFECLRTEARIGCSAASVASFHSPRQPGVMRPMASTWVASMQNIAAPESASELMWVKCQSLASPFSDEYWHIGETMMRLGNFRSRNWIGEKRLLMRGISDCRGKAAAHLVARPPALLNPQQPQPSPYGLMAAALISSRLAS